MPVALVSAGGRWVIGAHCRPHDIGKAASVRRHASHLVPQTTDAYGISDYRIDGQLPSPVIRTDGKAHLLIVPGKLRRNRYAAASDHLKRLRAEMPRNLRAFVDDKDPVLRQRECSAREPHMNRARIHAWRNDPVVFNAGRMR